VLMLREFLDWHKGAGTKKPGEKQQDSTIAKVGGNFDYIRCAEVKSSVAEKKRNIEGKGDKACRRDV